MIESLKDHTQTDNKKKIRHQKTYGIFKRFFDVIFSFLILILLSPLFLFLSILIKIGSRGPVIYSQQRIGKNMQPFTIYKFRTMFVNSEPDGPQLSYKDDPRVTKQGKWMRKFHFDELPQFWNVLIGDMSIVGPRPERQFFIDRIIERVPNYKMIGQVRPGLTSLGILNYGYASDTDKIVERSRKELIYVSHISFPLDCKILFFTLKTILKGKGV